jgi:acyl dehydratase
LRSTSAAKPPPPDLSAYETVAGFRFEPDLVARYSVEGNNRIHFDPEVARQFGFRAPIAGGVMGVRHVMAALCDDDGPPERFNLIVHFRRPMFWDEEMRVMATRHPDGGFDDIHLVNADNKIAVEGKLAV